MRLRRSPSRSAGLRDRGAAIVEFALVVPILIGLVLAIFEYGMAWHDTGSLERAVQNAGRVGAAQGDGRYADYEALRAIEASLESSERLEIIKVVTFRSTTADGAVPTNCRNLNPTGTGSFGIANSCNAYSDVQVADSSLTGFPYAAASPCPGGSWDLRWCPLGRDNTRPTSDFFGVYIEARYDSLTGLLPNTITIRRTAVFLLEPETVGT